MPKEKKKFYITTTLPYLNSDPHLGFALELVQADVIARHKRLQGYDVFFNTGTDEHGLKIFRRAKEENIDTQEFCDSRARKFRALKEVLNLSYNSFIRTTDSRHIKAAQEFWRRCQKNGDIYKKKYKIKYCVGCEMEKTESELVKGKCPLHPNQELEIIEEENYFFRYSKYQRKLLEMYEKNPNFVVPQSRLNEIKKFTEKGLNDFSISRLKKKMPWGIPVPGDDKQVIYVWFDALVNYISSLGWPDNLEKFKEFWPGLQVAGKDNLRQQASIWPAMLMSAGLPLPEQILIHGFITSNGQKMSKSLGNVIDPFELKEKYGAEAIRYYLLKEFSPFEDGDFTIKKFRERYNSDLANGLGNLAARILSLAIRSKAGFRKTGLPESQELMSALKKAKAASSAALDNFRFNDALTAIWGLITFCDKYIEKEKPWENKRPKRNIIAGLLSALSGIGRLLYPFLPETADKLLEQIKKRESQPLFPRLSLAKKN